MHSPDLTITQIRDWIHSDRPMGEGSLKDLERDRRSGVRQLARTARRKRKADRAEKARLEKMFAFEKKLRQQGDSLIAGVDEVGRGPLAGPVVAGAVVLPESAHLPLLNDSKTLTAEQRDVLYDQILEVAVCWKVGQADPKEIDHLNIFHASYLAMRRAIEGLGVKPCRVLVDGKWTAGSVYPELALIKGDARSASIAAASIVAKVTRDRMMAKLDEDYPGYNFAKNKGYPSPDHKEALRKLGPTPIHRFSFQAVQEADPTLVDGSGQLAIPIALPDIGKRGEALAADLLSRDYRILERRYHAAGSEIDIIATNGVDICFVEVKATRRADRRVPQGRVDERKQAAISRAAQAYLHQHPHPGLFPRFDVVLVDLSSRQPTLEHLPDAFRPHSESLDRKAFSA